MCAAKRYQFPVTQFAKARARTIPGVSSRKGFCSRTGLGVGNNQHPFGTISPQTPQKHASIFSRVANQKKKPIQKVGKERDIPQMDGDIGRFGMFNLMHLCGRFECLVMAADLQFLLLLPNETQAARTAKHW